MIGDQRRLHIIVVANAALGFISKPPEQWYTYRQHPSGEGPVMKRMLIACLAILIGADAAQAWTTQDGERANVANTIRMTSLYPKPPETVFVGQREVQCTAPRRDLPGFVGFQAEIQWVFVEFDADRYHGIYDDLTSGNEARQIDALALVEESAMTQDLIPTLPSDGH